MKPIPCIVCKRPCKDSHKYVTVYIAHRPDESVMMLCGRSACAEKYEEGEYK